MEANVHTSNVTEAQCAVIKAITPIILGMTIKERQKLIIGNSALQGLFSTAFSNFEKIIKKPTLRFVQSTTLEALPVKKTALCFKSPHWAYRDSDIDSWLPPDQPLTAETNISVYELVEEQTFLEMTRTVLKIDAGMSSTAEISKHLKERKHVLTLAQYDALVEKQQAGMDVGLRTDGYANLAFVELKDGSVAVARVLRDGSRWRGYVNELSRGNRWFRDYRLLVCNSDTLDL